MNKYQNQIKEEFRDEEYRYSYAEDFLNSWIATQIVTLREQRNLTQSELGRIIGTKQPGISRIENVNYSSWRVDTLKRIARALGVRLHISFETFGTLIEQDNGFSREFLRRPRFEDDPAFLPEAAIDAFVSCQTSTDSKTLRLVHSSETTTPMSSPLAFSKPYAVGAKPRSTVAEGKISATYAKSQMADEEIRYA